MKYNSILLVDDNDVDNYINKHVLSKFNITENIIVKSSAIDAIAYLETLETAFPDVIFLDIRMPEMDGFDFLDRYLSFPDHQKEKCTIYLLTSSINPEDVECAKKYTCIKNYLNKPLTHHKIEQLDDFLA